MERSAMSRNLTGIVTVRGTDDELWPWSDETVERTMPVGLVLDTDQPAAPLGLPHVRWGGECRVEVSVDARVVGNGGVQVQGTAKLFEGDSEDSQDLEDEKLVTFLVPRNTKNHTTATRYDVQLSSTGPGGGDHAEIAFSFMNTIIEDE
jgi:hypothetical protein